MKVSIFQFDVVWLNPKENLAKIQTVCSSLSGSTDLLILPEMFNTGYTMQPNLIPESWQSVTIESLREYATAFNITIGGTIPMLKNEKYTNTFIFVNGEGLISQYDKMHLFTLAGEKDVYLAGENPVSLNINEIKIQPLICYDLRFPYISYQNEPVDLIIYSANWPITRINHWKSLLKARAIENQCYVIGVNRTGMDENGYTYPGASSIIDYNGDIVCELSNQPECFTANIDSENMQAYRQKLPFLEDKRM
ncbi:MAG: nitrilase family protein [Saprospiraceae bacterium]|nr:nitrilase family protein [Saprospiraceae bacterium]